MLALSDSTLDSPRDLTINQRSQAQVFSNVQNATITGVNVSTSDNQVHCHQQDPDRMPRPWWSDLLGRLTTLIMTRVRGFDRRQGDLPIADPGERTSDAGPGPSCSLIRSTFYGPLGLILAPQGNLITASGDAVFGRG